MQLRFDDDPYKTSDHWARPRTPDTTAASRGVGRGKRSRGEGAMHRPRSSSSRVRIFITCTEIMQRADQANGIKRPRSAPFHGPCCGLNDITSAVKNRQGSCC